MSSRISAENEIRGVIFDLDGTLYRARALGLTIAVGMLNELSLLRSLFKVRKLERRKQYEDSTSFKKGFAHTFADVTGRDPHELLDWYERRFMKRFTYAIEKRGRPRPGLKSLLERLGDRGVKSGVVSDFGWVDRRLEAIGLSPEWFDVTAAAEDFGVMKPCAKPFEQIARGWGIPVMDRILLVGDRADYDEQSAVLSGARFIGVKGGGRAGPDFLDWAAVVRKIETSAGLDHFSK